MTGIIAAATVAHVPTLGRAEITPDFNLDVMADADWIIDLGPEGGDAGGRVVAQGRPEDVAMAMRSSRTAQVLNTFLAQRI